MNSKMLKVEETRLLTLDRRKVLWAVRLSPALQLLQSPTYCVYCQYPGQTLWWFCFAHHMHNMDEEACKSFKKTCKKMSPGILLPAHTPDYLIHDVQSNTIQHNNPAALYESKYVLTKLCHCGGGKNNT